ncbi:MAG: hypothetical protein HY350_02105 [Candidatus Omnitrophica bacterium]|nr:hypothetical protein [Candidatus Omnitrophota bacterium]
MKIEREPMEVIMFTESYKIEGKAYLQPGGRLSEFVNLPRKFIPITDARIFLKDGKEPLCTSKFLNVNKDLVVLILPVEEVVSLEDFIRE